MPQHSQLHGKPLSSRALRPELYVAFAKVFQKRTWELANAFVFAAFCRKNSIDIVRTQQPACFRGV